MPIFLFDFDYPLRLPRCFFHYKSSFFSGVLVFPICLTVNQYFSGTRNQNCCVLRVGAVRWYMVGAIGVGLNL